MTKTRFARWGISPAAALLALSVPVGALAPDRALAAEETSPTTGKEIAFDRNLGNCLACHAIEGGDSPGDVGPALAAMQLRFPDKAKLRAQIADPRKGNPDSRMPPFGAHKILSEQEIDLVLDFLYTL
ncbi:MAG: sulfur oxidation c-type cytochrome SoxX [Gammaproteobacteria bacterium]|nr:sulfur oxidation c-type cytochrome SoxX [Gammaproteobacteria bacterium]MBU1653766.1 sulfur oxidation c-type cytochrome SoxX [Gammaproteobacteria bacterium]MBU1962689.1 sulfur oxidation c-type cytochrome SoxX [Gammaproteobacteria bacterium]